MRHRVYGRLARREIHSNQRGISECGRARLTDRDVAELNRASRLAQRSNFVDRMMDEVVRSTPSSAPMRSMT